MNKKTIIFVFGTRPELIKVFPLIQEARRRPSLNVIACSTGQHKDMLQSLYEVFEIKPDIDFKLMKPNQNLINMHAETMLCMQKVIHEHKPRWVVVQGDTTSAHAAAMAAFYEKIPVAHVEAGLRTYDIHSPYPEEMNRRAIGLIAQAHFCPTEDAANNLKDEGVDASSFSEVTGNMGIDTLKIISNKIENSEDHKYRIIKTLSFLDLDRFILVTMHRRENFGDAQRQILNSLLEIVKKHEVDILFPVHPNPNVRTAIEQVFASQIGSKVFWMNSDWSSQNSSYKNTKGRIFLIDPLEYLNMIFILSRCLFVMTDSGGLQEEAPTFAKKILVLRKSTERPEGVEAGFATLVGTDLNTIVEHADQLLEMKSHWVGQAPTNPYGDGQASIKIIDALSER